MGLVKPLDSFSVPSPTHCYRGRVGSGATGGGARRKRAWWGGRFSGDDVGEEEGAAGLQLRHARHLCTFKMPTFFITVFNS